MCIVSENKTLIGLLKASKADAKGLHENQREAEAESFPGSRRPLSSRGSSTARQMRSGCGSTSRGTSFNPRSSGRRRPRRLRRCSPSPSRPSARSCSARRTCSAFAPSATASPSCSSVRPCSAGRERQSVGEQGQEAASHPVPLARWIRQRSERAEDRRPSSVPVARRRSIHRSASTCLPWLKDMSARS